MTEDDPTCDTFNPPAPGEEPDCPYCRMAREAFNEPYRHYVVGVVTAQARGIAEIGGRL
jgi:glutaredoxin